jgi:hypothetical protein
MAEVIKHVVPLGQNPKSATPDSERLTAGQLQHAGDEGPRPGYEKPSKAALARAQLPRLAKVMKIQAEEPGTGNPQSVVTASQALSPRPVLTPEQPETTEEEPETEPPAERPEWAKEFSDEDWKSLTETEASEGGIQKAYLNLRRQFGKQSNEIAQARRMAQQPPPVPVVPPAPAQPPVDIKALGEHFLDDIPGSVQKLYQSATDAALAKVRQEQEAERVRHEQEVGQAILNRYPGLIQSRAEGVMIDEMARDLATQPDHQFKSAPEIYDAALRSYAKRVNYQTPKETVSPNPETEAMAANAALPSATATVKRRAKVWTGSEMARIRRNPVEAARLDAEWQKAYRENRVDLSR